MSLSDLPLSYCTNVHPGRSVAEVEDGLDRYTLPVMRAFAKPMAAGLWLAEPVVRELLASLDGVPQFAERLRERGLNCHTLNAFPFGDFHDQRVKEKVYLPDWTDPRRLEYTLQCGQILAAFLSDGGEGSISTVPLGFKGFPYNEDFLAACCDKLIACAVGFDELANKTGKVIRLAIEPEPLCILETTPEAIAFFNRLWNRASETNSEAAVRRHIGLCFDICHQAVEFEDIAASIAAIAAAGIRINKVHISCAIELNDPAGNADARRALEQYVEPRYLHQTLARRDSGEILRQTDLTREFLSNPGDEFLSCSRWRVHFHVPVNAQTLGPLGTTRGSLTEALGAVRKLDYAPHLEVETYTWEVLPGATSHDLATGLTNEMLATDQLLRETAERDC